MEATIRLFYDGCNEANGEKMRSCLAGHAIHYFPVGASQGVFSNAETLIAAWKRAVQEFDSRWTIDRIAIDDVTGDAIVEWTHFRPKLNVYVRGDEWYRFDDAGKIVEIRAYYACPTSAEPQIHELFEFDYAGRGYATTPPDVERNPD